MLGLFSLKRISLVIVTLCMGSSIPWAGDHFKCQVGGEFGDIVWQDTPCRPGEEIGHLKQHFDSKEHSQQKRDGSLTKAQANNLIRLKKIAVGMQKRDVIRSWGKPSKIDVHLTSSGRAEDFIYYQYANAPIVNINNKGLVSSIHYSQVKKTPSKPEKKLGNVRTGGFGQYNRL